jgi:hypothetical protein
MKPSGNCYQSAFDRAMSLIDAGEQNVMLVHGSVIPPSGPWANQRITHAWVEVGATVHEFSNGNSLVTDKPRFVRMFTPETYAAYSRDEALMENLKSVHYGPWDDTSLQMGEAECN